MQNGIIVPAIEIAIPPIIEVFICMVAAITELVVHIGEEAIENSGIRRYCLNNLMDIG